MSEVVFEDLEQTSILGVKWQPNADYYTFNVNKGAVVEKLTKRIILSKISQLFDPNGYVAPVVVLGKMLMQQVWAADINWDDEVPDDIKIQWERFWSRITHLESIKIPRWIGMGHGAVLQLHGFADSSLNAYGCCVYLRAQHPNGNITCHLIASKSRVAPLKKITIARLELAATERLSHLINSVRESMELMTVPYYLWTDNTTALHWINKPVHLLKLFVANRVKAIQRLTDVSRWRHIRTHENPADLISRGIQAEELVDNSLWWHGPQWLCTPEQKWPQPIRLQHLSESKAVRTELKIHATIVKSRELEIFVHNHPTPVCLFDYTKNLGQIKRILTYVKRFIDNCRACVSKQKKKPKFMISAYELANNVRKYVSFPTQTEQIEAVKVFVRCEQQIAYAKEIAYFKEKKKGNKAIDFPEKSKLTNLNPFMDKNGLIRVGGRLGKAELPFDTRHPLIVPPHSRLSRALIVEAHRQTNHGGTQLMIQYIRALYWIPRLRVEIKNSTAKCTTCVRYSKRPGEQLMADLPADRIRQFRPFRNAGVDYAGPFLLKESTRRGAKTQKCWVAIFVCMCTRAVHLDLVTSLSSAAFIACYERFVATRGMCTNLYSDNGTSFVGAEKMMQEAFRNWTCPENIEILNHKGVTWTFMNPASPHQGGFYEAAVKSFKYHATRTVGAQKYTYEDYATLLKQLEAILNSRPLYAPTDDPSDSPVITPAHFLIGEPFVAPPPINAPPQTDYSVQRVRKEHQKIVQSLWESWSADYLSTLMTRKKWLTAKDNVQIGQVVLIVDNNSPPSHWQIARVSEAKPSKDGLVRTVVLEVPTKTKVGAEYHKKTIKLTRAVQKICVLPTESEFSIVLPIDEQPEQNIIQSDE